jgi:hypothetical protein
MLLFLNVFLKSPLVIERLLKGSFFGGVTTFYHLQLILRQLKIVSLTTKTFHPTF